PVRRCPSPTLFRSDSLRDQLLGLGFKPTAKPAPASKRGRPPRGEGQRPAREARPAGATAKPRQGRKQDGRPARTREDIDLAKAYAIRAQREKDERIRAERERQEQARLRREARARLEAFLQGRVLNDPAAEIARHFPYGGKIKRVYVNADQLRALNAGELGVGLINGLYCLGTAAGPAAAVLLFSSA